ncbi:ABC transporter permease [Paenibacillus faecalis]|uniref:ABC transporter permease n=1 Tax=Paenibacillus faecalis TaxID=2079532 RepID=UPI000D100A65|nr:ABC transporter permease [Paenibacillus faecalis]
MKSFGLVFVYSFKERLRSKAFTYMTLIMILILSAIILLPKWLGDAEQLVQGEIAVLDKTGAITTESGFKESVSQSYDWRLIEEADLAGEQKKLQDKDGLLGIVLIEDVDNKPMLTLTVNKADDAPYIQDLNNYVQYQYTLSEIQKLDLNAGQQEKLNSPIQVKLNELEAGSKSLSTTYWPVYLVTFMLYLLIYMFGANVAVSVSTEKGSRVKEILITKVNPVQLLFGKVFGVGMAGILQFAIIMGAGYLIMSLAGSGHVLELFGMKVDFSILDGKTIALLTLFFILGYFFYAALFAAAGSMVNRSEEVNQVTMPISIVMMAGFMVALFSMSDPEATFTVVSSYIPFLTPFVMFVRVGISDPSMMEIMIPTAILFVSTLVAGWVSAKIYQVGVLMYGQKLNPKLVYKAMKSL